MRKEREPFGIEVIKAFEEIGYPLQRAVQRFYDMKQRCENPNFKQFSNYGGRGIELRLERNPFLWWFYLHYPAFSKANPGKSPSINRINNDGHYEISNIEMITVSENSRESGLRGISLPGPKVDDMAVLTILTMKDYKALSSHFKISKSAIRQIRAGINHSKTYKAVYG